MVKARASAESNRWPLRKPARCGWNVEDVFEHLAASLAEKRMIGAGGLDQGIEPSADPVQAADANAATVLWISQHHERSRGDMTKSTSQQIAAVQSLKHVVLKPIECKQRPNRLGREREFGVIREMNRPAEIGDTKSEVAADVAAQPGRRCAAEGLTGCTVQRSVKRVDHAITIWATATLQRAGPMSEAPRSG